MLVVVTFGGISVFQHFILICLEVCPYHNDHAFNVWVMLSMSNHILTIWINFDAWDLILRFINYFAPDWNNGGCETARVHYDDRVLVRSRSCSNGLIVGEAPSCYFVAIDLLPQIESLHYGVISRASEDERKHSRWALRKWCSCIYDVYQKTKQLDMFHIYNII